VAVAAVGGRRRGVRCPAGLHAARNVVGRIARRSGSRLVRQRRQFARFLDIDAEPRGNPRAVVFVSVQKAPDHAFLNPRIGFLEIRDEVIDEVVAMRIVECAIDLAGLLVVVNGAILDLAPDVAPRCADGIR
jgi:hypothetical protein